MKKKFFVAAALAVALVSGSVALWSQSITPANTTPQTYNLWFKRGVAALFGNYPEASIQYDGTNLVIDVTHGGGTVSFPHGLTGTVSPTLTNAHILVGNASNVGTDVAMTGDIGITNGGVTSITAGAIVNADIANAANIAFSKLAPLSAGNILVGGAGNLATSVALGGDVSITPTGVSTVNTVTASGTITSTSPTGVGAHILSAANTACNTTCTGGGCLHGWETTAGEVAVECADATADKCLCMH